MNKIAIKLLEYERMFRVIHSVSEELDDRAGVNCMLYNTIGAFLIESTLKIKAKPVMGAAFVLVNNASDTILSFSKVSEGGEVTSDEDNFHCWVETQDHIIDFTAPVYQKYFDKMGSPIAVPNKMFQKRKSDMLSSYKTFSEDGDYFVQGNRNITKTLLSRQSPALGDLADICLHWYKSPPRKMNESMTITNDLGEVSNISLTPVRVSGAW